MQSPGASDDHTSSTDEVSGPPRLVISQHLRRIKRIYVLGLSAVSAAGVLGAITVDHQYGFDPRELVPLVVMYTWTGLGITIGYHRYFSHKAFKTGRWLRALLAASGSMAGHGPVIAWVATHRCHHKHSDGDGDPHSPHAPFHRGLRGLWHAHMGWLLDPKLASSFDYARDLLKDPLISRINRLYPYLVLLGLALAAAAGAVLCHPHGGVALGALRGLLWGGFVRMFLNFHATCAINSIGHRFGTRAFDTREHSTNGFWLAAATLGEGWHNNHHAFAGSAQFSHAWWQLDPGHLVICLFERLGLVWDVHRPNRLTR